LFFKPDGTKFYITGGGGFGADEYNMSTAWDVSSASHVQFDDLGLKDFNPSGIFFKDDGTKMYMIGSTSDSVHQYSLSTAWDISSNSFTQSFSVSSQETGPQGVFFKPDGTKMYVVGLASDNVNEYSLSTAWDISTASYVQSFSVSTQDATPSDVFFNPDGDKMYVSGSTSNTVYEYNLTTAWDVSTASYSTTSFSVASQETTPSGIFFKSDGSKMYVIGSATDTIYQYST